MVGVSFAACVTMLSESHVTQQVSPAALASGPTSEKDEKCAPRRNPMQLPS